MAESMFADGPVRLDTPDKMLRALKEMVGVDASRWRGGIDCWALSADDPTPVWRLQVNDDRGATVTVLQGQYLVVAYGRLLVLDPDEV